MVPLFPPHIRTVAVISPAGPVATEVFAAGTEALRGSGVRVKIMPHANGRDPEFPYLSAPAAARAADLTAAWLDPEVDLLFCGRGGFGSAQLLPLLDFPTLRQRRMPVVGFSDITALHWAMTALDVGIPIAGPMLSALPELNDACRNAMCDAIAGTPRRLGRFKVIKRGRAEGLPIPGNLSVAMSLAGTGWMPDLSGRILLFEDVNEPDYRLDRMFTQLEQCGSLSRCAGAVFGDFSGAADPERLIRRAAAAIDGPVLSGFPFGHGAPFPAVNFRQRLLIDDDGVISASATC